LFVAHLNNDYYSLNFNNTTAYYLNDFSESKKRIVQEIASLRKDSDRDVRDTVLASASDKEKTELLLLSSSSQSSNEISNEIPALSQLQIKIVEPLLAFEEKSVDEKLDD
jgi:hypothetical protein